MLCSFNLRVLVCLEVILDLDLFVDVWRILHLTYLDYSESSYQYQAEVNLDSVVVVQYYPLKVFEQPYNR